MTTEQLENILNDYQSNENNYGTTIVGRYIIQPIYWSEDENGAINYDVESMRDEINAIIDEYEEHNESTDFVW